ncbi:MAG TPA: zinc ribbon domain-containing protein [Blastocatellia bacterium]|nr:zinc ribbon domain-containing protein [Blastocatellia bacterium]
MYCPKCGTENVETNKYCRACRENLKIVSQAMKQRLPVVLASRFDQMFDSRSERFRRDSVLCFLIGLILLVAQFSGPSGIVTQSLSCYFFLLGVWEYLAYRRSLAPDFDWGMSNEETKNAERFDKGGVVPLNIMGSHTENNARTTNKKNSQPS